MENEKNFDEEFITIDRVNEFDDRTIERCYELGSKGIDVIIETGRAVRRNCITILGWVVAALTSLIGFLICHITFGTADVILILMAVYGIIASALISYKIYSGALSNIPIYHSGVMPSMLIRTEIADELKTIPIERKYKYVLGYHLNVIQDKYKQNLDLNERIVDVYRSSVKLICILLIGAAVLFVLLELLRSLFMIF